MRTRVRSSAFLEGKESDGDRAHHSRTRRWPARAAARPALTAEGGFILAGYALIVVGAFVGWGLWRLIEPDGFTPAPDMSAFAVLYVFAQGIERVRSR